MGATAVVVVVGMKTLPAVEGVTWGAVAAAGLAAALRRRPLPSAVVLAGDSLAAVHPGALAGLDGIPVVGVAEEIPVGVLHRWEGYEGFRTARPGAWVAILRVVLSHAARPVVRDASWRPRGGGREGAALLDRVHALPRFKAEAWAAAAGMGLRTLHDRCVVLTVIVSALA